MPGPVFVEMAGFHAVIYLQSRRTLAPPATFPQSAYDLGRRGQSLSFVPFAGPGFPGLFCPCPRLSTSTIPAGHTAKVRPVGPNYPGAGEIPSFPGQIFPSGHGETGMRKPAFKSLKIVDYCGAFPSLNPLSHDATI